MSLKLCPGKSFVIRRIVVPNTGSTKDWPSVGNPGVPGSHVPGGEYGIGPVLGGGWLAPSVNPCAPALTAPITVNRMATLNHTRTRAFRTVAGTFTCTVAHDMGASFRRGGHHRPRGARTPFLRQPGCQGERLTRSFAAPPHDGCARSGRGSPRRR